MGLTEDLSTDQLLQFVFAHNSFGADLDSQPANSQPHVTCGPTPATSAEPIACLTHTDHPSSWHLLLAARPHTVWTVRLETVKKGFIRG